MENETVLPVEGFRRHEKPAKDITAGASRVGGQRSSRSVAAYLTFSSRFSLSQVPDFVLHPRTSRGCLAMDHVLRQECGEKSSVPAAAILAKVYVYDCFEFAGVPLLFEERRDKKQARLSRADK